MAPAYVLMTPDEQERLATLLQRAREATERARDLRNVSSGIIERSEEARERYRTVSDFVRKLRFQQGQSDFETADPEDPPHPIAFVPSSPSADTM